MAPRKRAVKSPPKPLPNLPMEVWAMVFEISSPQALINVWQTCKSFNILLKQLPKLWTTARKSTFGEECPDPPLGLTEMQYATLTFADRCQETGCTNTKPTSVRWAMQKRLCTKCFSKRIFVEYEIHLLCHRYPRIDDTLLDFCYIRYTHAQYTYTGDATRPAWAGRKPVYRGYDIKAVRERVRELDQLPEPERYDTMQSMLDEQKRKMMEVQKCERFFLVFATTVRTQR